MRSLLIPILFSVIFGGISHLLADEEPPELEEQIRLYMSSGDTLPDEGLRSRLQARETELKPILSRILGEIVIVDPAWDYSKIVMLADLSWGFEDQNFDVEFWRSAMLKFSDWPAETAPIFFDDYLKRDPEGAEEVFSKLRKIGNDNVKNLADQYLEKSKRRKNGGSNGGLPSKIPRDKKKSPDQADAQNEGDAGAGEGFLIVLGTISLVGIIAILIRSSLRQRRTG